MIILGGGGRGVGGGGNGVFGYLEGAEGAWAYWFRDD